MPKTYNNGTWTQAKMVSFIKSQLRNGHWPPKYECKKRAYVGDGINPKTGRVVKLYKCAECEGEFKGDDTQVDHIHPVVPLTGFDSWDGFIGRLYCEVEGLQLLCKPCHKAKCKEENKIRRENRKKKEGE